MVWFFCVLIISDAPGVTPWQETPTQWVDLHGMESPTSLLFVEGRLLATGDLDEAFAGVYVLNRRKDGFHAQLLKYLPQMDVEDLGYQADSGQLRVISARRFSAEPDDWVGQFMALEPGQLRLAAVAVLDIPPLCFNKSMRCGLVAAFPLDETSWVAVKKQDPSTLYLFDKRGSTWYRRASASLTYKRRFISVTAVRKRGSALLFLVKDQWLIGSLSLEVLRGELPGEVRLESVFAFDHLKEDLRTSDRNLEATGMAEGFDIDASGHLYIALNNRSKPFLGVAGATPSAKPKIVIYPPQKNKSPFSKGPT